MQLGLHVCDFNFDSAPDQTGSTLARISKAAEDVGFESLTVMDHLFQIAMIGPHEDPMLEAYTTLSFIAGTTSRLRLGAMVTAAVYRPPGLLVKAVTTLDVLSGGRAFLGIGAAWNEQESIGLGLPFPPTAERFERLEETLQIAKQMWSDDDGPYEGKHYHLGATVNSPQAVQRPHPPILIGGSGEKKTIPLAARHFDHLNVIASFDQLAGKLDVVRQRCEEIDRDPATLETSMLLTVRLDDNVKPAEETGGRMLAGSADFIAEQVQAKVLDAGIDGVIINMPSYTPGVITAVAEVLRPVVGV